MLSRSLPAPLALHFGALGLAGGWMLADGYRLGALQTDGSSRLVLTIGTPLVAALVGNFLARAAIETTARRALLVTVATTLGAGVLVGLATWAKFGIAMAALSGLGGGLAFLPAVGAMIAAARNVGRARPGSVIDVIDRRAVLLATVTPIALGSLGALPSWFHFSWRIDVDGSIALAVLAVAVIGVVLAADIATWIKLDRLETALLRMIDGTANAADAPTTDLGVGETIREEPPSGPSAYRVPGRPRHRVIGDIQAAHGASRSAIARDGVCLLVAATAIAIALVSRTP